MQVHEIIRMHPHVRGQNNDALVRCIEECASCAQVCTSCADACLGEDGVKMLTQCIRLDLDCADICNATARIATRRTGADEEMIRRMLDTCAAACRLCADECEKHAQMHEHCRICAEACRRCLEACEQAGQGMRH
ncbi:MAG: four-helix bundle copper-binding protein [Hyphomicrobiales bacterium]|nr:MAG: four-helix bundle copper-binding protein [Hyphomicrobiales bacterium]